MVQLLGAGQVFELVHAVTFRCEVTLKKRNSMTNADWNIDPRKIQPIDVSPTSEVETLDSSIEQVCQQANLPFDIKVILGLAKHLNVLPMSERVPWVEKLLEMDYSLGPFGYALRFNLSSNPKTYAFFQLQKYDSIYRPMKYVYKPFGMSFCPAASSREIAESACAHVEKCVKNLFAVRTLKVRPKATLGEMVNKYPQEFDSQTLCLINSINDIVYGKTKHEFEVQLPRLQLLSLAESLAVYFVCRVIGLKLLQQAGTLNDVVSELKRSKGEKVFIGMEWAIYVPDQSPD